MFIVGGQTTSFWLPTIGKQTAKDQFPAEFLSLAGVMTIVFHVKVNSYRALQLGLNQKLYIDLDRILEESSTITKTTYLMHSSLLFRRTLFKADFSLNFSKHKWE